MKLSSRLGLLLRESIIDRYNETLPLDVWDRDEIFYHLRPSVRKEIIRRLDFIPRELVKRVAIVGSIVSHYYNPKTDIDVHIISRLDPNTPEMDEYEDRAEAASHKPLPGTRRPVNFYIHEADDDFRTVESVYDVLEDKWQKYTPLFGVDIREYLGAFKSVVSKIDVGRAELYRDLIDYRELSGALQYASEEDINEIERELHQKLKEINSNIDELVANYKQLKAARTRAYYQAIENGEMDRARELAAYTDANVVYKMLEKYSYMTFLRALKRFREERGKIKGADVSSVANIMIKSLASQLGATVQK